MRINQILTEKELKEIGGIRRGISKAAHSGLTNIGAVGGGIVGGWDALKRGFGVGRAAVGKGQYPEPGTTIGRTEYVGPAGRQKEYVQKEIQNAEQKLNALRTKLSDIENSEIEPAAPEAPKAAAPAATPTPAAPKAAAPAATPTPAAPEAPKAAAPAAKSRTGGKVAGQVSQSANAARQRAARAAKRATVTAPNLQVQQGGKQPSPTPTKTKATKKPPEAPTAESLNRILELSKKIQCR